jgi:adenosylcobyric acid synthase
VEQGTALPGDCDLILIPGSKATISDLEMLNREGWDIDIKAHRRRGGRVLGLCGGYQILGQRIRDPDGVEGRAGTFPGLGLLRVDTTIGGDKTTLRVSGRHVESGEEVAGYEIHLGRTAGADCERPFLSIGGNPDGAISSDGLVAGTYVHGLFASDGFRRSYLERLGVRSQAAHEAEVEAALDGLAAHLERHLDLEQILAIAKSRSR